MATDILLNGCCSFICFFVGWDFNSTLVIVLAVISLCLNSSLAFLLVFLLVFSFGFSFGFLLDFVYFDHSISLGGHLSLYWTWSGSSFFGPSN